MSALHTFLKYWRTVRHLKPVQFYGRLTFRYLRPTPDLTAAPALAAPHGPWAKPAARAASLLGPTLFDVFGVPGELAEIGWDGDAREKLWRYNQHYFDDLNARGNAARASWHTALIARWIADNAPGQGTAWEPYPTSLRIVNWVKWQWSGNDLDAAAVHSLAVQARWLGGRLEWHLLGNHLFCNAKALVFAGLAFEGVEPQRWLGRGLEIIEAQLPEQILADGGNFEGSPMYHAIFLEDVLDLLNAARARPGRIGAAHEARWRETATRMLTFLAGMTHPDGGIALFNDAALNIAPTLAELSAYAASLGLAAPVMPVAQPGRPASTRWPDSGYVRLDTADATGATALLDVAPVGPDYLPGHAHADTLSFELSLASQRVIVNGGTSCYGLGAARMRERQTVSHSTVEVDHHDSSEVWGGFRVARRAYPFDYVEQRDTGSVTVACSHDGYRRLPGRPVHRRTWTLCEGRLEIGDRILGTCGTAQARYIFHPAVRISAQAPGCWALSLPSGAQALIEVNVGHGSLAPAYYSPEFGTVVPTTCLLVDLVDGVSAVAIGWPTSNGAHINP
jgi:uncharacterized heparinase superfamily protein